jgi:hypothetical protein
MARKNNRITARQILAVLQENKSYALRFSDIYKILRQLGTSHYQQQISQNLQFLISRNEIVRVEDESRYYYGIPNLRENGTRFIIIKGAGIKDEIIELMKE